MLSDKLGVDSTAVLKEAEDRQSLMMTAETGWSNLRKVTIDKNTGAGYALDSQAPVVIEDLKNDDRFNGAKWLLKNRVTSGIIVIVKGSSQRYGLLGVYTNQKRSFTNHEISFVKNAANIIGEAIERINTEVELRNAYGELEEKIKIEKQLQKEILEVEKKERWRLGQYLHDGTAQNLLGIKMLLDIIDPKLQQLDEDAKTELEKIKRLIVKTEGNIRELSHFVLPIENEEKISKAFKKLVKLTHELYDVECTFDSEGIADEIQDSTTASSLYYISQEAIRNAISHGQAKKVEIELSTDNDCLLLEVRDNGIGYDKDRAGDGRGINIMKHRADLLGGELEIRGGKKGTSLKCNIPIDKVKRRDK